MGTLRRLLAAFEEGFLPGMRLRRQLRKAHRGELATLPENTLARVSGIIRPFEKRLLEAPLSGRLCVYYAISIVAATGRGHRASRREIGSEHDGMPFMLDDGTATAVIDPDYSKISVAFDHISESAAAFDADPRQRAVLDRHWLARRDWFGTERVHYREGILEADEMIAVLGAGVREPDPDAAPTGMYREARPLRLRFTGTARYPLVISDDPRSL